MLFSQSKQNNDFPFQKSCRIYIFYKKNIILGKNLKILAALSFFVFFYFF